MVRFEQLLLFAENDRLEAGDFFFIELVLRIATSEIRLGWGVWAFAASVVLSLIASVLLHKLERVRRPAAVAV